MSSRTLTEATVPGTAELPRMLVVGAGPACHALSRHLDQLNSAAPHVVGIVAPEDPVEATPWPYLGDLETLTELLDRHAISEVAICLDSQHWSSVESLARTCSELGVAISIPAANPDLDPHGSGASRGKLPLGIKRAMDIVGAGTGLVVAGPLLLAAAAAVFVLDGRPIFFRQTRAGQGGRSFKILKFRTMQREADGLRQELRAGNEISGGAFKMTDDPRVTRLGRWLRRLSVDELPQLWNVLKGEMSLVGPRPHPYDDIAGYQPWHLRRLAVKPGLTGLWQVELRGDTDFDRWVGKDIEYIERWSIWLDLKLMARTIPAVLRGTGR